MAHDNDGEHVCKDCGTSLLLDHLKFTVQEEIGHLEDLLHQIRSGLIADVRLADGVTEDEVSSPWDFEWKTL
jgi:hypothetical protein